MKVFIAGPRAVSILDKSIEERLYNIYNNNYTVLVGDANGVDKSIQNFYNKLDYKNVIVFASEGKARNNIGYWKIENVAVNEKLKGYEFYAQKDKEMAKNADYGFMIWNGKSKGTLNNIINLVLKNKKVLIYFIPKGKFVCIDDENRIKQLVSLCPKETEELYYNLLKKMEDNNKRAQVSLTDIHKDNMD